MLKHPRTALAFRSTGFLVAAGLASMLGACAVDDSSLEDIPLPSVPTASRPPPPISGGTLLVTTNNQMAIASDPDRDRILLVDLASKSVVADLALNQNDEPGRVAEGPEGHVFVALRRGGDVVSIDLAGRKIESRTKVCPAPRGLAYDNGALHVACASGELVTLDVATNSITRTLMLGPDLRDVVVKDSELFVSRMRSAGLIRVSAAGDVLSERRIESFDNFFATQATVAYRMVKSPDGGVAFSHQMSRMDPVNPQPGGYGEGPCGQEGIVTSKVSFTYGDPANGSFLMGPSISRAALPVDIAFNASGTQMSVVGAGSKTVFTSDVALYQGKKDDPCAPKDDDDDDDDITQGEPIAVAYAGDTRIVQTREPARLVFVDDSVIELGGESVLDTGHQLFHQTANAAFGVSCASCHPEGQEDGHVWFFFGFGERRTQNLSGGILATAPLHWDGALAGFDALMTDVFTGRMGGQELSAPMALAAAVWVDSIPVVPVSTNADLASIERGKELYNDPAVGCASCHSGSHLTNNQTVDVGTAGAFQVPTLRSIAGRAPFMHNGCAPTLKDRFTNPYCGGGDNHGVTSNLSSEQIDDLVHYLETL